MSKTNEVPAIKHPGWLVKSTKTGKTLRHIKVDGKKIEYLGHEWCSLSAFAWVDASDNVIPHFDKKACQNMAEMYILQTGDHEIEVTEVDIF